MLDHEYFLLGLTQSLTPNQRAVLQKNVQFYFFPYIGELWYIVKKNNFWSFLTFLDA